MKFIVKLGWVIFATLICSAVFAAPQSFDDQNCEAISADSGKCACIIKNAVNDCMAHMHNPNICNQKELDVFFKNSPGISKANCKNYGGVPGRCDWSVDFYDNNPAPSDTPPVVNRGGACPAP